MCDVTHGLTPSPCHKLSHFLKPPPLERDVLYGRPLTLITQDARTCSVCHRLYIVHRLNRSCQLCVFQCNMSLAMLDLFALQP